MQIKEVINKDRNLQFVYSGPIVHPSPIRLNNLTFEYCQDDYNNAHSNERTIEIPLAEYFVQKVGEENLLEVGAVMPYYGKHYQNHQIVDLDDRLLPNVINADALTYDYTGRDVLCVSTLEHFDQQDPVNSLEISKSVKFLEKILNEAKNYFITFPVGFNKRLDEYVKNTPELKNLIFKRVTDLNDWFLHEDSKDFDFAFFDKYFCAEAICVITSLPEFLVREKLRVPHGTGGMGDALTLSPLARNYPGGIIVELLDLPQVKRLAPLFDGVCEVEVVKTPRERFPHHPVFTTHAANCLQEVSGIFGKSYYPHVVVKEEEKEWARNKLNDVFSTLSVDGKKPLMAFTADGGGTGSRDNQSAQHRYFPNFQEIINEVSKKYTILQFGLSRNHTKFEGVIPILDLSLRELIGMYSVIKRYFGLDSGDYHLMLSCGGFCNILVPESGKFGYFHEHWLYTDHSFKGELNRVKYYKFDKYQDLINDLMK